MGFEGLIIYFFLFIILMGIIYFVIKEAINNSKAASDLEEIKMILRTILTKVNNNQNEENGSQGEIKKCPSCGNSLNDIDFKCKTCGMKL